MLSKGFISLCLQCGGGLDVRSHWDRGVRMEGLSVLGRISEHETGSKLDGDERKWILE